MRIPYMSPRLRCVLLLSACFVLNGLPHTVVVAAGKTMEQANKQAQDASVAADKILKAAKEKVDGERSRVSRWWTPVEQTNAFYKNVIESINSNTTDTDVKRATINKRNSPGRGARQLRHSG